MKRNIKALTLTLSLILLFYSCNSKPIPLIKPPDSIGDLKLGKFKTGKEALKELFRLHGRKMGLINGYVADYTNKDGKATVYYSVAKNEKLAGRLISWMIKRIGKSHEIFRDMKKESFKSQIFYSVYGMNQKHFFFCKNDKIIWIAADPQVAYSFIENFLNSLTINTR